MSGATAGAPTAAPLFTVVVATRDAAALLPATLDSLAQQTCTDWELWLIDAASRDGTAALARQRGDARLHVLSEPDGGIADAWNKGVQSSQGRWLVFLGAGDTLAANALERLAPAAVLAGDEPCILVGDTAKVGTDRHQADIVYAGAIGPRGPLLGFPFMHPGCATSRSVFDRVGGFDMTLRIAVDSDFLLRAWCADVRFAPAKHTAVMLTGGVSDRRWLAANLEYAGCVARQLKLSPAALRRLRWGVHLRHLVFKRLGLSRPLRALRQSLRAAVVAVLNVGLRGLPGSAARRGLLRLGGAQVHASARIGAGLRLWAPGRLQVGAGCVFGHGVQLDNRAGITLGEGVHLADGVRLCTQQPDIDDPYLKRLAAPIAVGDGAQLATGVIVLPGVRLGAGAVVAPGSVLSQDLPPGTRYGPDDAAQPPAGR